MTTASDERAPCEVDRAGEKFPKKQNSSGVSEQNAKQSGSYASISASELEQILKQKPFTRSEIEGLIAVLNSRIREEDIVIVERDEASTTSGSLKKHKHGDESDNSTSLSKTSTTMENLVDELLLNIFIRLSAKQLAQMRSVSKSWNAILSQSSFIKSHLDHSVYNNDQILLVFHEYEESIPDFKPFTTIPCRSPHFEPPTNFIKLPVNPRISENTNGIEVIGSVDGLICSCYGDSLIQIWNPSLSAVLTLPPSSMPSGDYDPTNIYLILRFGYDPKTNDYKVLKLTCLTEPPKLDIKCWLQIEIYSMRKGTWDLINQRFPLNITDIDDGDYACADGHNGLLHWLAEKVDSEIIVAFDLGSETFREILH